MNRLSFLKYLRNYLSFILVIFLVVLPMVTESKIAIISAFIIIMIVYIIRGYESRILLGAGLILLVLGGIMSLTSRQVNVGLIGSLCYYFLTIGVITEFISFIRAKKTGGDDLRYLFSETPPVHNKQGNKAENTHT